MEELIGEILNIENRAQEVIRDAREAKKELDERVALDSIKIQNDIEKQAREKNEAIRDMENSETEKRLAQINEQTDKAMSALEEKYSQNKEQWVNKIVSGVIGGLGK